MKKSFIRMMSLLLVLVMMLSAMPLALAEEINVQAKRAVEFGGEGLSEDERQVFYKALTLISENLKKLDQIGL